MLNYFITFCPEAGPHRIEDFLLTARRHRLCSRTTQRWCRSPAPRSAVGVKSAWLARWRHAIDRSPRRHAAAGRAGGRDRHGATTSADAIRIGASRADSLHRTERDGSGEERSTPVALTRGDGRHCISLDRVIPGDEAHRRGYRRSTKRRSLAVRRELQRSADSPAFPLWSSAT